MKVQSFILAIILLAMQTGGAETNSWIGAFSGYWENPEWSLGALPGTNQTILFTNAGWKALGITANTAQNYPQTLSVDSITIASPTDSFNTLLLNYAGFQTPLLIGGGSGPGRLIIASNSAVVMFSSALIVRNSFAPDFYGAFSIGGTFTETEGSQVSAGFLHLGNLGPAVYNLTNSTLSALEEHIGGFPATFNQQGGTNTGSLYLESSGQYNLFGGSVGGWIGLQGGGFSQWDGNVSAGIRFTSGAYHLAGGSLSSDGLQIPGPPQATGSEARGSFLQTGGTNFTSGISLGYYSQRGDYTLSGGVLIASSLVLNAAPAMHASGGVVTSPFYQTGGFHTNGGIYIVGYYDRSMSVDSSVYFLSDGILSTPSIGLSMGAFAQSGGTNQVGTISAGSVSIYYLSGGCLIATNICLNGGDFWYQTGSFQQSGGTNQVSDTLWLGGGSKNVMSGGRLIAQNFQVSGASFLHSGGTISIPGVLTLGSGTWDEQTAGGEQLGTLQLGENSSLLLLPANGPCILHFGDSSSRSWTNQAVLVIERWDGSALGNGQQQIVFGNSPSGLTSPQLKQIQFHNPANLAVGTYPARILATGEIVPDALFSDHNGQQLVLSWGPRWTLQTTTNFAEPFIDLESATSPYTNHFTDPQRLFRLRR